MNNSVYAEGVGDDKFSERNHLLRRVLTNKGSSGNIRTSESPIIG
jgi:hypothetical protein